MLSYFPLLWCNLFQTHGSLCKTYYLFIYNIASVYHIVTMRVIWTSWAHVWRLRSLFLGTGYDRCLRSRIWPSSRGQTWLGWGLVGYKIWYYPISKINCPISSLDHKVMAVLPNHLRVRVSKVWYWLGWEIGWSNDNANITVNAWQDSSKERKA
jgi:hypothetical protein